MGPGSPINTNGFSSELMNQLPSYIKPLIYGTDNKDIIAKKEKALRDIYAGHSSAEQGKIRSAFAFLNGALDIFVETQDELLEAFTCFFLGELHLRENQLLEAKDFFKRAYDIFDKKKNLMFLSAGQKIREIDRELSGELPDLEMTKLFPESY